MLFLSNPACACLCLCVCVCSCEVRLRVCYVHAVVSIFSHSVNYLVMFSMNHNMQLHINHFISFGAAYADARHPSPITTQTTHTHARTHKHTQNIK